MKKFFVSMLMSLFTIGLYAQEGFGEFSGNSVNVMDPSYRIYLGPKFGVNFSTMSGIDELNPSAGVGLQGGLAANFRFGRRTEKAQGGTGRFGLQVEALYSRRSISTDYVDVSMNCFELPILVQYYFVPSWSIEVGPTVCFSSPTVDNYNAGNYRFGADSSADVMISAGIGYRHKSGFMANARYNRGLNESFVTGKVSTFSLSVGWLFSLKK